uniref:Cytoplasmic polyadenylation element-binding protein 1 n=1 Tax=Plectus sambesii TaxID=2011161 RepID=A0A914XC88_9BILA
MSSIKEEPASVVNGEKEESAPSDTSMVEETTAINTKNKTSGRKGDGPIVVRPITEHQSKDVNNNYKEGAEKAGGNKERHTQPVAPSRTPSFVRHTSSTSSPGVVRMPTNLSMANQMIPCDQTAMAMGQQFFMQQLMAMQQQHQASTPYYYNWINPYAYNYDYTAKLPIYPAGMAEVNNGLSRSLASMGLQEVLPMNSTIHQRPPQLSQPQKSPPKITSPDMYWHYNPGPEIYSRKVFVGGLPIDVDEDELNATFSQFGPLVVDWPHKTESKTYFPPKGYVFLIFEHEPSVQALVAKCYTEDDKLFLRVSSPTMEQKPVQIRPWRLADADFVVEATMSLDPRKTIFVGGVPRPLKAVELAHIMDRLYGGVSYAGIDTDPELKYPKGAGRVSFTSQQAYIAAISARFVQLNDGEVEKRVEVKPYVLDEQMCDECLGQRCGMRYAPFFCPHVACLQYFCEHCWSLIHSRVGRDFHKPLIKEVGDTSATRSSTSARTRTNDFLD